MVSVAPLPGVCLSLCLTLCLSRDSLPPNWDSNSHHNRPQQPVLSPAGREKKQTKTLRSLQKPIEVVTWAQKREQLWVIKSFPARLGGLASPEAQLLFSAQQRHKLRFSFQVTWAERAARPVLRAVPCVTNTHTPTRLWKRRAHAHTHALGSKRHWSGWRARDEAFVYVGAVVMVNSCILEPGWKHAHHKACLIHLSAGIWIWLIFNDESCGGGGFGGRALLSNPPSVQQQSSLCTGNWLWCRGVKSKGKQTGFTPHVSSEKSLSDHLLFLSQSNSPMPKQTSLFWKVIKGPIPTCLVDTNIPIWVTEEQIGRKLVTCRQLNRRSGESDTHVSSDRLSGIKLMSLENLLL